MSGDASRLEKISARDMSDYTGLTNPRPSSTASTIPAVKEEQLSWLISRGTEILRVMTGSLSIIMSVRG